MQDSEKPLSQWWKDYLGDGNNRLNLRREESEYNPVFNNLEATIKKIKSQYSALYEGYPEIMKHLEACAVVNGFIAVTICTRAVKHEDVLRRKYDQLVYRNDYGIQVKDAWHSELSDFLRHAVMPLPLCTGDEESDMRFDNQVEALKSALAGYIEGWRFLYKNESSDIKFYSIAFPEILNFNKNRIWWLNKYKNSTRFPQPYRYFEDGYILLNTEDFVFAVDCVVNDIIRARNGKEHFLVSIDGPQGDVGNQNEAKLPADGYEYEAFCAERLRSLGWDVIETNKSGDQGVDLIGTLRGVRVVFQCKFYSSPVGNGAVQEAIAGKVYEKADHGVVISNASFTKQARQLASAADILLIHHDDLGKIEIVPASPH